MVGHTVHFDFVREDIIVGQFFGQKLAFNRLDLVMQLVFKAFKVGRAVRPLVTPVLDKLPQALNRGSFQNQIGMAQCHR